MPCLWRFGRGVVSMGVVRGVMAVLIYVGTFAET